MKISTSRHAARRTAPQSQLDQFVITMLNYDRVSAGTDANRLNPQRPGITSELIMQVARTLLVACYQPGSQAAAITALVGPNGQPAAGLTAEQFTTVAILQGITVKDAQGKRVTLWSIACKIAAAHQPRAA